MIRRIITIDQSKCNGCGACAKACHEGAIGMVNGKAQLLRDDYCDGLGDCLPACPTGAISFEMREAAAYDEVAVNANRSRAGLAPLACGCPGTNVKSFDRKASDCCDTANSQEVNGGLSSNADPAPLACGCPGTNVKAFDRKAESCQSAPAMYEPNSELSQWPVQIKLAPVNARFFNGAHLLIAADCSAYAYAPFHHDFIKGRIALIGCPKLDATDYSEKLVQILMLNDVASVTVVRMEVPCCGGIERAVRLAVEQCGKALPLEVITLSTDGMILNRQK